MSEQYPYGDPARALEQLGWMKSEISNRPTEAEVERRDRALRDYVDDRESQRIASMEIALNNWWEHHEPKLLTLMRAEIKRDRESRDSEFRKALNEKGLEIGEDGQVRSKVNPVRLFIGKNWFAVLIVVVAITVARPDWFGYAFTFLMRWIT